MMLQCMDSDEEKGKHPSVCTDYLTVKQIFIFHYETQVCYRVFLFVSLFVDSVYDIKETLLYSKFATIFMMNNCLILSHTFSAFIRLSFFFCPFTDVVNYINYFSYAEKLADLTLFLTYL